MRPLLRLGAAARKEAEKKGREPAPAVPPLAPSSIRDSGEQGPRRGRVGLKCGESGPLRKNEQTSEAHDGDSLPELPPSLSSCTCLLVSPQTTKR